MKSLNAFAIIIGLMFMACGPSSSDEPATEATGAAGAGETAEHPHPDGVEHPPGADDGDDGHDEAGRDHAH